MISPRRPPLRLGRFCYLALNVAVVVFSAGADRDRLRVRPQSDPYIQFPPVGVSLRWFEKFFASRDFMNALWLSLEVAAMTTIAATLFGASAALRVGTRRTARHARHHRDHAVAADAAGDPDRPCAVPDLCPARCRPAALGTGARPYAGVDSMVRTTLAVSAKLDTRLEEAARNLGAGPLAPISR